MAKNKLASGSPVQLILVLACGVILSAAFVFMSKNRLQVEAVGGEVEGASVDSASNLMRDLQQTVDDGGESQLRLIDKAASGL